MYLEAHASTIASMAGYPSSHPHLGAAIGWAESILTSELGPLDGAVREYTTPARPRVALYAIPLGEVLEAPPGRLERPGLWRVDPPPSEPVELRWRVRAYSANNPHVLRAAAELVAAYLELPDPRALAGIARQKALALLDGIRRGRAWVGG